MRDKQGRTPLDIALGVGAARRTWRGWRSSRPWGQPSEEMATLLRELMAQEGTATTAQATEQSATDDFPVQLWGAILDRDDIVTRPVPGGLAFA